MISHHTKSKCTLGKSATGSCHITYWWLKLSSFIISLTKVTPKGEPVIYSRRYTIYFNRHNANLWDWDASDGFNHLEMNSIFEAVFFPPSVLRDIVFFENLLIIGIIRSLRTKGHQLDWPQGNSFTVVWRSRTEGHLGQFWIEPTVMVSSGSGSPPPSVRFYYFNIASTD